MNNEQDGNSLCKKIDDFVYMSRYVLTCNHIDLLGLTFKEVSIVIINKTIQLETKYINQWVFAMQGHILDVRS